MDRFAHQTLELCSFFRYFPDNDIPQKYYDYLAGNNMTREALFAAYPEAAEHAKNEALQAKLGTDTNQILARIRRALANNPRHWIRKKFDSSTRIFSRPLAIQTASCLNSSV
jgi:DNA (cytosine-5)-methyltransferase 1